MQFLRVIPSILATTWLLSLHATGQAAPIPIDFVPQDQTVELGDQVTVDIVATPGLDAAGLTVFVALFDIIVNWDISLMTFVDATFGAALGGGPFNSLQAANDLGGGSANAAELSLLFDFTGLQDGSAFTLFSLTFDTIGIGTSALEMQGNILGQNNPFGFVGGFFGAPLEAEPGSGSVTIVEPVAISEPATLLLVLAGLLVLGSGRRESIAG